MFAGHAARETNMKTAVASAVALVMIVVAAGQAKADGKFYEREKVPPGLPYQRTFLIFYNGTETLAVQSKYSLAQGKDANSLGWVVPTPNAPELASMDAAAAHVLFFKLALGSPAKYLRVSKSGGLILVGGLVLLGTSVAILLVEESGVRRRSMIKAKAWERLFLAGFLVALLGSLLILVGGKRSLGGDMSGAVEVVKAEQVGIYDVSVVKSATAEPIVKWLTENGFHFGDRDKAVFADYVRKGWCFVVAKIGARAHVASIAPEGLTDPLVLTFRTDKPVYPLALTAAAGTKTEVLLYALSTSKLACGGRLRLRYAGRFKEQIGIDDVPLITSNPEERRLLDGMPTDMMLCKFKGTLTPDQMKEDLVFEPAADNTPYRPTRIIW